MPVVVVVVLVLVVRGSLDAVGEGLFIDSATANFWTWVLGLIHFMGQRVDPFSERILIGNSCCLIFGND